MKKLKYLIIMSILSCTGMAQTPNSWTQVANFGGIARADVVSFSIDSFGYTGLGVYASDTYPHPQTFPTDFWQYNPYTNVWVQKAGFPGAGRYNSSFFVIGEKAYVGLGANNNSQGLNDFWEYDAMADTWTQKANFGGGPRASCLGFSIGGKGYIGMGYSDTANQYKKDMWEYDPISDTWTQLNNFPGSGILEDFLFGIGSEAYIGIGYDSLFFEMNDFWQYTPSSDNWIQLSNLPGNTISGGSNLFNIQEKGYASFFYDSSGFYHSTYFWEYNSISDQWSKKDSFPGKGVQGMAAFSIGNKGYMGIGVKFPNNPDDCANDFWMYTPDSINTGIKPIDGNSISISPNPVSDKLYINLSFTNYSISISDMTGQTWPAILSGNEIDVSALPAGVYCLRVQNTEGSVVRKFVKE